MDFTLHLEQDHDYEFRVKFDWPGVPELLLDEPDPLGHKRGPIKAEVTGRLERNERGRYRIDGLEVAIEMSDDASAIQHFDRCAEQFEDFCIVTESIRKGIPVKVKVTDSTGRVVHQGG